jgi:hypothetical protein
VYMLLVLFVARQSGGEYSTEWEGNTAGINGHRECIQESASTPRGQATAGGAMGRSGIL